jgi:hypothetical protein
MLPSQIRQQFITFLGGITTYHVGLVKMIDISKELISSFNVDFVVGGSTIIDVSNKLPVSCTLGPLRRQALYHIKRQLCPEDSTINMYSHENLKRHT